ncbi:MAG: 3-deoxy-7-phosphoheptulonate synthase [Chloroflexi bacterium]|nr:3-deoxy-7-phosphoheptulonate synthase [Chloroflexota bacterium]
MVIIMKLGATTIELDAVMAAVSESGFRPFLNPGVERKVVAVLGEVDIDKVELMDRFSNMAGVERVQLISEPFKLSSRHAHPGPFAVDVRGVQIGGTEVVVIAGPCSVESEEQLLATAREVRRAGARLLRGGAFKPRTSPHSFQGLGEDGLKMLAAARDVTGLPVVTELMDAHDIDVVCRYADMLQIGARNMQNFSLLRYVGQTRHPVLLKRGPGSKVRDFLMAAEYILAGGNTGVVLCERGIITFEDAARYTTDINAIPILKGLTHLPVILDPSHSTGNWAWVQPIALAGIAAGADGLIVEVHPDPQHARSDGKQSLKPKRFVDLMAACGRLANAVDRTMAGPAESD